MTDRYIQLCYMFQYFNSHPHEEDDRGRKTSLHRTEHFNSHPHEEDDNMPCCKASIWNNYFNSHPHEEDDQAQISVSDS